MIMDKIENETRPFFAETCKAEGISLWGGFKITYTAETFEQRTFDIVAYILRKYRLHLLTNTGGVCMQMTKEFIKERNNYEYKWEFFIRFFGGRLKDLPKDLREYILTERNWEFTGGYAPCKWHFMKYTELNGMLPDSLYNDICAGARVGRIEGLGVSDCMVSIEDV